MKNNIKNIIFDLGDVILNIDIPKTVRAFAELSGHSDQHLHRVFIENELFRKFETGSLSEEGFRNLVREILEMPDLADTDIDNAWNALLLDIPPARIGLLEKLADRYQLYLLSNTSSIHITKVNQILHTTSGIEDLRHLFKKLYFSYEMGIMKPDPQIYLNVLEDAGIEAAQTLFLDDNQANIEAAGKLGINIIHVQKPTTILEYLSLYV
ncbi:MAG: haloacid dehalogenase [Cytophagaceae bacterium SCN 52-12]|nr:MAG: haloacid dehalogenase [Cytophagaceae bacterium SCN 52-12]